MRRILVTGTTGFIGSALIESLTKNNYEVWCTTRNGKNLNTDSGVLNYISCDLTQLEESIGSFYAVINCAASLRNDRTWKRLSDDNCNSLENLILNIECSKFIQISTCSIFSKSSQTHSLPDPPNIYGLSKYVSEKILELYSHKFDSKIIIRFPIVIGANKKTQDFVKYIFDHAVRHKKIELYAKGAFYRNVIHITEAISSILSALANDSDFNCEKINVGSLNSETVFDICRFIVKETNSKSEIILSEYEGKTDFNSFIDVSKCSIIDYNCLTIRENIKNYLSEVTNGI